MDSVYHNADDDRVYLGITSFNADIFRAFDRATGEFEDLGYGKVADPFDAKFHRSLVRWEKDGCLYGAIALLHDIDRYWEAPRRGHRQIRSGDRRYSETGSTHAAYVHPVDLPGPGTAA